MRNKLLYSRFVVGQISSAAAVLRRQRNEEAWPTDAVRDIEK